MKNHLRQLLMIGPGQLLPMLALASLMTVLNHGCGSGATSGGSSTSGGGSGGTSGGTATVPCTTTDTWSNYAQSLFAAHCSSCHGAGGDPGPTYYDPTSYASVSAGTTIISQQISSGAMPQNATLSASDKSRILAWLACSPPPQ